jgi:hypothetical protein
LLVHAWLGGAPQVEIKDARELVGRRQHHELAAILESAALNDAVKQVGLQSGDNVLEARCVENAIEHGTAVPAFSWRGIFEFLHMTTSGNKRLLSLVSQLRNRQNVAEVQSLQQSVFMEAGVVQYNSSSEIPPR